ncbi:MFS transporter [Halomonas sp. HP20-15]|uniref:MFS transporter n=1 Tax=Halomonas sp. HP20-15 TaxID=3085901 RepID=UPI002981FDD8|nr:MFS transporter [Halomonas sp. HP20-15]MDW5376518.1 MFS transporter [Halomonas sp. HP20-15]
MAASSSRERTMDGGTPSGGQALFYLGVLIVFLAASSAPTPLYPLYQQVWGFSSTLLTLIFAVYMFALLLTLLVSGSLSDQRGRKPVIALAVALEALSMGVFLLADGPGWLLAGRILQGVATGIATSALAAAMLDSHARHGPLMTSVGPLYGMAFGALFSGLLVGYAPAPLRLVFALLLGALLLQLAWLPRMRETAMPPPGQRLSLRPRVQVPTAVRAALLRVVPVSIAAWALGGFSLSLGPSLIAEVIGLHSPAMGGLLAFLLPFVGGSSVLVLRHQATRLALLVGGWGLAAGMALMLVGVHQHAAWLLLVGTTVAGTGFGAGFMGVIRTITPLAAASERSALMAALYVICYLSASVPALIAGAATQRVGLETTTYAYGSVVIGLAVLALVGVLGDGRRRAVACPDG